MNDYVGVIVFLAASWLAIRSLLRLTLGRRDDLQGKLIDHVRATRIEQRKQRQINALRLKIRNRQIQSDPTSSNSPQSTNSGSDADKKAA